MGRPEAAEVAASWSGCAASDTGVVGPPRGRRQGAATAGVRAAAGRAAASRRRVVPVDSVGSSVGSLSGTVAGIGIAWTVSTAEVV